MIVVKINNPNTISIINEASQKSTIANLKVGDIIRAKVINISNDIFILDLGKGQLVKARKDSETKFYSKSNDLSFIISDIDENKVYIKPLNEETQFINRSMIKIPNHRKEIISFLLKHELPISEEIIKQIESTKKNYGKVIDLIKNESLFNNEDFIKEDINKVLKTLILDKSMNSMENTNQTKSNKTNDDFSNKNINTVENSLGNINQIQSNKANNNFSNENIQAIENLSDNLYYNSLKNITEEKLVFLLKNELDFNLENIKLFDDILLDREKIGKKLNQVVEIINKLNKNNIENSDNNSSTQKLLNLISRANIAVFKNKQEFNKVIEEIFIELEDLKLEGQDQKTVSKFNRAIEDIKSSLKFISQIKENNYFIQIPIYINNQIKNLDIIIKREEEKAKQKKSIESFKIFISLNTNNLNTVQSLIEVIDKKLYINFKVYNEKILKKFKKNENILIKTLNKLGFKNNIINYKIFETKETLMDFSSKKYNKFNNIDMKV